MKRKNRGGRFSVEHISNLVMTSRMMRVLSEKAKKRLAGISAGRMRSICILIIAGMFIGEMLLVYGAAHSSRAAPSVSAIRPVTSHGADRMNLSGAERRRRAVRAFNHVWDSLMLDPAMKKSWEDLVKMRPRLADTLRQLQGMDSIVAGR